MKRVVVYAAVIIGLVLSGAAPASAGTGWQSQRVPRPVAGSIAYLNSTSCFTTATCVAVGTWFKNGRQHTLAEHWNGSSWTIQRTPDPPGPEATLVSLSCTSPADCMAVGYHSRPVTGGEHLLTERWNGTNWALQYAPEPTGATESEMWGVSCASPGDCMAVGQYQPAGGGVLPLVEHWNGTNWIVQTVPFVQYATGELVGVSCPTVTDCFAVGAYGTFNQNTSLFAEHWNGSQWAFELVPRPRGESFALNAVSCLRGENCVAVGTASTAEGTTSIVERASGGAWALQQDAVPANAQLHGVSCPSLRSCTAVGLAYPDPTTVHTGLAEHWNGTTWARQALPEPQPDTKGVSLGGISCLPTGACTAVGVYGHPGDRPLADNEG
jgi:hypothetical protein